MLRGVGAQWWHLFVVLIVAGALLGIFAGVLCYLPVLLEPVSRCLTVSIYVSVSFSLSVSVSVSLSLFVSLFPSLSLSGLSRLPTSSS